MAAWYLADPRQRAYLEALPDGHALLTPAGETEYVVGHVSAPPAVLGNRALENGVGEYHAPRSRAYGNGDATVLTAGGNVQVSI